MATALPILVSLILIHSKKIASDNSSLGHYFSLKANLAIALPVIIKGLSDWMGIQDRTHMLSESMHYDHQEISHLTYWSMSTLVRP
jgi:hypothetical protein